MTPRLLITGSRDWADQESVEQALKDWWESTGRDPEAVLVSGGCRTGADRIAETLWANQGLTVEVHPARWKELGAAAGPVRNQQMVDSGVQAAAAFIRNSSRGASGTLRMIEKAGVPVRVYSDEPAESHGLPLRVRQWCCAGKTSCGKTEFYLVETVSDGVLLYGYNRVSNGEERVRGLTVEQAREFIAQTSPQW